MKKDLFKVEVKRGMYFFEVLINGLPHVEIDASKYAGFQSWKDSDSQFVIEYYFRGGSIRSEFDSGEKWVKVLTELKKNK